MAIISNWVLRIIIFIIIATVIDALLPENKMKQYVYLVFGFILFLIFTQPLFYLFSIDINKEINNIESIIDRSKNDSTRESISYELQKNEIELEQRAYILEQAKNTLINEANSILENEHDAKITDLQLRFKDDMENEEIEQYDLTMIPIEEQQTSEIEPVVISTKNDPPTKMNQKQTSIVTDVISQLWGVQKDKINVTWEEKKH